MTSFQTWPQIETWDCIFWRRIYDLYGAFSVCLTSYLRRFHHSDTSHAAPVLWQQYSWQCERIKDQRKARISAQHSGLSALRTNGKYLCWVAKQRRRAKELTLTLQKTKKPKNSFNIVSSFKLSHTHTRTTHGSRSYDLFFTFFLLFKLYITSLSYFAKSWSRSMKYTFFSSVVFDILLILPISFKPKISPTEPFTCGLCLVI